MDKGANSAYCIRACANVLQVFRQIEGNQKSLVRKGCVQGLGLMSGATIHQMNTRDLRYTDQSMMKHGLHLDQRAEPAALADIRTSGQP